MSEWKLEIKAVNNGFVLRGRFHDNETISEEIVKEEDKLEEMRNLLYEIKEYFGVYNSKHNKRNLFIKIE